MKKRLILISGISGAGKTTVSNILEDMGYLCIDQYPSELLKNLIDLIENNNSIKYQYVALTISLDDLEKYRLLLDNTNLNPLLILIEASLDTIINRYKFTRRVHPLLISNKANTLEEAAAFEKKCLENYKKTSAKFIDTTNLSTTNLKEILDHLLKYDDYNNFSISFQSFGFKNGIPQDADLVFDVRFLDNPYYVETLKFKTGNDKEVYDFVMNNNLTKKYLDKLLNYLEFSFKAYDNEQKRHITVCIGCTGGQHRSVSICNYLYEHYKDKYLCYKFHRELKGLKR